MNETLRQDYAKDLERVVSAWNRALEEEGSEVRLRLPNTRFFRRQGIYAGAHFNPEGALISAEAFEAMRADWLPTDADRAYVSSLMKPVYGPGQMAQWIAAPRRGINRQPLDFAYVRTDG